MQRLLETTQHLTCEGPGQVKLYNSYEATWKGVKASLHSRLAHIIIIVQWRSYFMEISRGLLVVFFFSPLNEHQRHCWGFTSAAGPFLAKHLLSQKLHSSLAQSWAKLEASPSSGMFSRLWQGNLFITVVTDAKREHLYSCFCLK